MRARTLEDTESNTENSISDVIEGIPGFPVLSIGLAILIYSTLIRMERDSAYPCTS